MLVHIAGSVAEEREVAHHQEPVLPHVVGCVVDRLSVLLAVILEAEGQPYKIELLNLEGCKDPKAKNYKAYFVKDNPKACR